MKNKLSASLGSAGALLAVALLLFPVAGHCEWFSSVKEMIGAKGKNMKDVATKIATLNEDEDIRGLDFSPDGKYLATTSPNTGKVHIWDWRNKAHIVKTLEKKGSDLGATEPLQYSPDGRLLVWCGGTVARIWNTDTWQLIHSIDGTNGLSASGGGCEAVGFAPDGKSLILVFGRVPHRPGDNLVVYDASTWQAMWGLRTFPFEPNSLAISPNGNLIALGGEVFSGSFSTPNQLQIAIVDLVQRAVVRTINNRATCMGSRMAFSPNNAFLAAGGCALEIFDAHTYERVVDETTQGGNILIRFTPDGKYLIEGGLEKGGTTVKIWGGQHRTLLQELKARPGSMAVSRDGRYLAMGGDKKILVFELK